MSQILEKMKKVLAIAFIGSLVIVSCSKKVDHSLQDSNTMLAEPEATTVVDSSSTKTAEPAATPAPAATDSTATK